MNQEHITTKQMKVLLIFFLIGDMMWYLPSYTTSMVNQDAWLSSLIGIVFGIGVAILVYKFWNLFGGLSMVGIFRLVTGRVVGSVLTLLYILYLLSAGSAQVRVIGDFMTTQMLTETPVRVVIALFAAVVLIAVRCGITVIGRTSQLFIMLFVFLFVLLFFMLLPESDIDNLKPFVSHSVVELARGSFYAMIYPYFQLITLLMVLPAMKKDPLEKEIKPLEQEMFRSMLFSAGAGMIVVLLSLTVLGTYMTEHQMYSTYTMAKKISIGNFIQRMEAILVISYVMSTYFKCTLTIYAMCKALTELMGLKDYRQLAFPVYVLLFGTSYYIADNSVFFRALGAPWSIWEFMNMVLFVGVVYVVYLVRKGKLTAVIERGRSR